MYSCGMLSPSAKLAMAPMDLLMTRLSPPTSLSWGDISLERGDISLGSVADCLASWRSPAEADSGLSGPAADILRSPTDVRLGESRRLVETRPILFLRGRLEMEDTLGLKYTNEA